MSFHFLDGNSYGAYTAAGPGEIIVDPLATVHATAADTPALTLTLGSWSVVVNGGVAADSGHGINLRDAGAFSSQVIVDEGAAISAGGSSSSGINAAHVTNITNRGSITGGYAGINATDSGFIKNSETGMIEGARYGIRFGGDDLLLLNGGTIKGGEFAVLGGSGVENIANYGTIEGGVFLGDGNDIFQNYVSEDGVTQYGTVTGRIVLGKGTDIFEGGDTNETVVDGDGKDLVKLAGGNDAWFGFLAGGDDVDETIDGGAGVDTYDASQSGAVGVAINLDTVAHNGHAARTADDFNATTASDTIFSFENAVGTLGQDFIFGTGGANTLIGNAGDDFLSGEAGNDTLKGDAGMDTLTGGRGKDTMYGGADADIFDFNSIKESLKGSNRDVIQDFKRGQDDIDLKDIDAKKGVSGNQKFKFIGKQDFHDKKGELRYEDKGSKVVVQGDVNGDGKADFEIMVKVGSLSAGDFLL
ncbi:MAG: calcium-binding protein [Methyloceanibacter sp.]|uniref:calcium-binding protein n=1 Tax=Methyloceanibacter sp. TaxID=1965321 RepID=UPI003D6C89B3